MILLLAPLAADIPLCALAAILFVVAYNMSDVHHFLYLLKHAPRNDMLVLLTTFLLTVFTDLVVAVNVGVLLAVFLFTKRMSQTVTVELESPDILQMELKILGITNLPKDILVYTIEGPFFFGAAEKLAETLRITHTDPKTIIFRLKHVPFMDVTGLETFYDLLSKLHQRKINVFLCEAHPRVMQKLTKINCLQFIYQQKIYPTLGGALTECTILSNTELSISESI